MKKKVYNAATFTIVFCVAIFVTFLWEISNANFQELEEPTRVKSLYPMPLNKKKLCNVHTIPLIQDNVSIGYGLFLGNPYDIYFPKANIWVSGGCIASTDENNKDVLYCPICRQGALTYLEDEFGE